MSRYDFVYIDYNNIVVVQININTIAIYVQELVWDPNVSLCP